MVRIEKEIIKKQPKFWNHALFHPTDAVEDPWGKRILDRMAADGAIKTIRIYSMFEDIVYVGEDGELCYYVNGELTHAGLIFVDNAFYYISSSGKAVRNTTRYIGGSFTNDLLPAGEYTFGADGKMTLD